MANDNVTIMENDHLKGTEKTILKILHQINKLILLSNCHRYNKAINVPMIFEAKYT